MGLYGDLFESMLSCCDRTWLRHGPVYTVSMMALAIASSLNVLSVIDLLWIGGVLNNPYQSGGELHPSRLLCALLCAVFVANSALARRQIAAAHGTLRRALLPTRCRVAAPLYLLASATLFLITLLVDLAIA